MMKRSFSFSRGAYRGLTVFVVAVLPFLILSFFNHPQNDDYVYAARAETFGFVGANVWWFTVWSGRYLTTAILSMSPLVIGSFFLYKFVAAAIILLLGASLLVFFRTVAGTWLTPARQGILAVTVLALYLYQMPAIAEGIYWMTGAVNYQLGCILLFFVAALLFRVEQQPRKNTAMRLLGVVLIIATAGTNELAMLLLLELLVLMLMVDGLRRHRLSIWKSIAALVSLAGVLIVTFAPGTRARYALSSHDLMLSIRSSFAVGGGYLGRWLLTAPVLPATALLMPLLAKMPRRAITWMNHPLVTVALFLLTYFALYFPSFYGSGIVEPRTVTVIYLYFLVGFLMNVAVLVNYLEARMNWRLPAVSRVLAGAAVLLMIVQFLAFDSNLKSAWSDLATGTAYRYSREQNERYDAIESCPAFVCEVDPLRDKPKTIFYFENAVDEKADSEFFHHYKDGGYAAYFHKWRIRLKSTQ